VLWKLLKSPMLARAPMLAKALAVLALLSIGAVIGWRLKPAPDAVIQYRDNVKERIITRTTREPSGNEVVVRDEIRSINRATTTPTPLAKPQYKVGALLPLGAELKPTLTAGRRLSGGVWLETQFNTRTREVLVGVSVEF
jgi:hypothetical protein